MPQHPVFIHGNPMNAAARRAVHHREYVNSKVIKNYRETRDNKFTSALKPLPERFRTSLPYMLLMQEHERFKFAPFSTLSIGRAVEQLYFKYSSVFKAYEVSLPSYYFYTLTQLHAHMSAVSDPSIPFMFLRELKTSDSDFRNLPLINRLISNFGVFEHNGDEFHFVIPLGTEMNPHYITVDRLSNVLEWLSSKDLVESEARRAFLMTGALPGAVFDQETFSLLNSSDYSMNFDVSKVVEAIGICKPGGLVTWPIGVEKIRGPGVLIHLPWQYELCWYENGRRNDNQLVELIGFNISIKELRRKAILYEHHGIKYFEIPMKLFLFDVLNQPKVSKFGRQQWRSKFKNGY